MQSLSFYRSPSVLFGAETRGDAAVVRLTRSSALVLTTDFFAPVVDDPFDYGRIAAANALSDVWAVGGTPVAALNIVGWPDSQPRSALRRVLEGGAAICRAAKVSIVGGHSVRDDEPKYGLAVAGRVDPRKMILNSRARPGDRLILTKSIGTGLITTGIKRGVSTRFAARSAIRSMATLNREASMTMRQFRVHACTDVTGFGLLGHLHGLVHASRCGARIHLSKIPVLPGAFDLLRRGCVPGGTAANRRFLRGKIRWAIDPEPSVDLLADPQTSGGLLMAVDPRDAESLLAALRKHCPDAQIIGDARGGKGGRIEVLA